MTSYSLTAANINPGPATIISTAPANVPYRFRASQIRNPAGKILVPEPCTTTKVGDAPPLDRALATPWAAESGRWEPLKNLNANFTSGTVDNFLTCRHENRANCGFADGHAQLERWQFGTNALNSVPSL
jgi:prepilin-type processing-associated H-X9-DG protein